tara:strand:+ start:1296 stop:1469 length:174 start_codon:yes stop_codon:yes gene_type:complete
MPSPRVRRLRKAARVKESSPVTAPAAKLTKEVSTAAAPVKAAAPSKKVKKASAKKAD